MAKSDWLNLVMPGPVPGIHAETLMLGTKSVMKRYRVDGRDKPGHDGNHCSLMVKVAPYIASLKRQTSVIFVSQSSRHFDTGTS